MTHATLRLEEPDVSEGPGELDGIDQSEFARLAEPHRRELHVHCYRMLASFEDAEDAVQETLLRAWRRRETFAGRSTFRAWLYKIATNACLDLIAKRRPVVHDDDEVLWLQPYPDRLLDTPRRWRWRARRSSWPTSSPCSTSRRGRGPC